MRPQHQRRIEGLATLLFSILTIFCAMICPALAVDLFDITGIDKNSGGAHYNQPGRRRVDIDSILSGGSGATLRIVGGNSNNQSKSTYLLGSTYDVIFADDSETTAVLRISENLFDSDLLGVDVQDVLAVGGGATLAVIKDFAISAGVPTSIFTSIAGSPALTVEHDSESSLVVQSSNGSNTNPTAVFRRAGSQTAHTLSIEDSDSTEWAYFIPASRTFLVESATAIGITGISDANNQVGVLGSANGSGSSGVKGSGDTGVWGLAVGVGGVGVKGNSNGVSGFFQNLSDADTDPTVVIQNAASGFPSSALLDFRDSMGASLASVDSVGAATFPGVIATGNVSAAAVKISEGSNATMGRATLSGGTVTVNTNKATTTMEVQLTRRLTGGTPGHLSVGTVVAATSFVINSSSGSDTSDVSWVILEPGP